VPDEDIVWLEFVESKVFYRRVRELSIELLTAIQADLIENPERGAIVVGTGGARKARVAEPGRARGKSGSYRYLYLYLPHIERIHLLYIYGKDEQDDLSPQQKGVLKELGQAIRKEGRHGEGTKGEGK
jgi:hypothetical protein